VTVAEDDDPDAIPTLKSWPVPAKLTVCGLPGALSVIVSVPVRAPDAVGLNVTLIVQFPAAATLVPQVLLWAKSPLAAILVMVIAVPPEFSSFTVCALELEPTSWPVKVKVVGVSAASGPT
jgi:hypothetical protein